METGFTILALGGVKESDDYSFGCILLLIMGFVLAKRSTMDKR